MAKSLSEIRTDHVIVKLQLAGRDRDRLRFTKNLVEKALSGNKNAQDSICWKLKKSQNKKGSKVVYIAWDPLMITDFFEDKIEAEELDSKETSFEDGFVAEPGTLGTTPPLSDILESDFSGC